MMLAPSTAQLGPLVADLASIIFIKGSLLILCGIVGAAVLRSANAATRSVCWTALALALMALPAASAFMPRVAVRVPAQAETLVHEWTDARGQLSNVPHPTNSSSGKSAAIVGAMTITRVPWLSRSRVSWSRVTLGGLLLTWALGVAFLLAGLAQGLVLVRSIRRRAAPIDLEDLTRGSPQLRDMADRRVRILASDDVQVPVTGGVARSFIILPGDWRTWQSGRLRAVIVHELAHVARHDFSAHLLFELVRAVYWPNPLVWRATARATADRELAADDRVLADGTSPADYATELLAFAATTRPIPVRGVLGIGPSALLRRIRSILESGVDRGVPSRWLVGLIVSVGVVGTSSVASLSAAPSDRGLRTVAAPARVSAEADASRHAEHVMVVPTLGDARTDSLLRILLLDREVDVRRGAARGLRASGATDDVTHNLVLALSDSCHGDRYRAARALRELRDKRAVPALVQQLLADDHAAVRAMLANAIAASGAVEGAILLRAALAGAPGSSFERVARAIDTLGETSAHARLLSALQEARRAN